MTGDSRVVVSPGVTRAADAERFHRMNRYSRGRAVLPGGAAWPRWPSSTARCAKKADLRRQQQHFLDTVSHELKSPLASLRLSAETIALARPAAAAARRAGPADACRPRPARADGSPMCSSASRLDRANMRAGRATHCRSAADVESVAGEVSRAGGGAWRSGRRRHPGGPASGADHERVRTVLRNLLHNAIKATPRRRAKSPSRRRGTMAGVHLQVRDTGIGFPPRSRGRLFEKFYRVEGNGLAAHGGTGLGLYLVRRCVEARRRRVSAAESHGAGARRDDSACTWPPAARIAT